MASLYIMSIHVLVIGAGIAGLSSAISTKLANPEHKVTILESAHELADIGVSSLSSTNYNDFINPFSTLGRPSTNTQRNTSFQTLGHL